MINLHIPAKNEALRPTITVIGVGGAGGNAVNNMIAAQLEGVNFVVANTDAQAIDHSLTERTIQLGAGITRGLGAGANPDVGRAAAEEAADEIASYIEGSNMVFITAGMGGGTGTGAAPVVARIAREQGILTVAVVTKPFQFEGTHRMRLAESGLKELQDYVDTLIIIPNQNLFRIANEKTTFADAFKMADEVLHSGVRGVTDLMVKPGLINLDFADIRAVMREMGKAMMGTGEASGERRAVEAAEAAISNPLLDDVSLKGAKALLINITGGNDMTLFEVDEAANRVREEVDPDANIIFGSTFSDAMQGKMRVSVVATGIDAQSQINPNQQKFVVAPSTPRQPYTFASAPVARPVEASKPVAVAAPVAARPAYEPAREVPRINLEQRASRIERNAELPPQVVAAAPVEQMERIYQEATPAVREPASAPEMAAPEPRRAAPAKEEPQAEREPAGRSFFQRMADVGRALSSSASRNEEEVEAPAPRAPERVQVVQKNPQVEVTEKPHKVPDEDQYLDIPAFLRRQAN